jgi:multiple sugar transport system substrate-binding protein
MNKLALKEDGQWMIQFFRKFAPKVEYGVFPYPPAHAGEKGVAKLDGSFWAIPVGTRHPDEAWTFLSWLIAPPQNARLCAGWLNVPPMRATMDEPIFAAVRQDEKFEFFVKLLADGTAIPQAATPVNEQLYDKLENGAQRVFGGSLNSSEMLRDVNEGLNQEMDRMKYLEGTSE